MNDATSDVEYAVEAAAIRQCFALARGSPVVPDERALASLVYLVNLTRHAPVTITHEQEHKDLRAAVRTLLVVLPGLIAGAEAEAAAAAKDGRASDMGLFAWRAKVLLGAAEPFSSVAGRPRDRRGWWHGWARMIADEVLATLRQNGRRAGVQKATSPAVIITCGLLARAGADVKPGAVVEALRDRPGKRVK